MGRLAQVGGQLVGRGQGGSRQGANHDQVAGIPGRHVLSADSAQATRDPVTGDGVSNRLAHDEPHSCRLRTGLSRPDVEHEGRTRSPTSAPNGSGEVGAPAHAMGRGQHRSGSEASAALTAARRKDGATGAGAHPEPEAVGLGPTPVVGLERTLGHKGLRGLTGAAGRGRPPLGRYELTGVTRQQGTPAAPYGTTSGPGVGQTGPLAHRTQRTSQARVRHFGRRTIHRLKSCRGGGGDTPQNARYGGLSCGQPLDAISSAR